MPVIYSEPTIYIASYDQDNEPDDSLINSGSPDTTAQLIKPEFANSPPGDTSVATRHEFHDGVMVVPVCGPPGSTQPWIVQMHAPYATRSVRWTAERVGLKPILPHWNTGNPYQVAQYRSIEPQAPVRLGDGRYGYRVSGTYMYVMSNAPNNNAPMANASMPFDLTVAPLHAVEPFQFQAGILDGSN